MPLMYETRFNFNAHVKAKARQFLVGLKSMKKVNRSIIEYEFRVKVIANSLLATGDAISKQRMIDSIFDGLLKRYNPFVKQTYESLFYVHEVQLNKLKQELALSSVIANVTHTNQQTSGVLDNFARNRG